MGLKAGLEDMWLICILCIDCLRRSGDAAQGKTVYLCETLGSIVSSGGKYVCFSDQLQYSVCEKRIKGEKFESYKK